MPYWFQETLLALDLETTGLDPLEDRIVQAAVLLISANGAVSNESWMGIVDPGVPVPVEASGIHGITNERAWREGVSPTTAMQSIGRLIDRAARDGIPVVIYNAAFDWPFVLAEARRHGVVVARPDIIDPLVLDKGVDRFRPGSRKLVDVAAHYGHDLGRAHDARADAGAAAAIARAVGALYKEVGDLTPAAMQPLQARWFAESAQSLAEHLGEPIDDGWPLPRTATHLE